MRSSLSRLGVLLLGCAFVACGEDSTSSTPAPPASPPLQDGTSLTPLADEDPSPDAISVTLEARESEVTYGASPPTKVWTYNGTIPAPLIDAKVGDTITVHFTNHLPEPTTIHWHGVRLPATMDGTLAMQQPIEPGASFTYSFTFTDAGLFWFHPHMRSDIQVQKGLYGAIRVRGAAEPEVDDERVLVLDDVRLKSDGSLAEYLDDKALMMGREGNTLLVNGQVTPTLRFRPGALVRLRVVNTANGRFFHLKLPAASWRVIGTDGGMIPGPYDTERVLMSPGERYDVLVRMPMAPGAFDLTSEPYERGHDSGEEPPVKVATFSVEDAAVAQVLPLPAPGPSLERLPDGPTDFTLTLDEKSTPDGTVFTINDAVFPDVPTIMVADGSTRVFEVKNDSPMDHPFHLHGFFFQILARNGQAEPAEALLNKDTIIVPMHSSLKLVTRFDEPGMWMYHCHILEHAEHGMMGEIQVEQDQ